MKQIITIIIIVVALGGAGFFGYKFLVSNTNTSNTAVVPASSRILPYGTDLQFDAVKKYNKDGKLFPYPVVSPGEIGPDLSSIVR